MAQKKKDNPVAEFLVAGTALAGAALGAAAVVLSDKKNQDKIRRVFNDFSGSAQEAGKKLKQKVHEMTEEAPQEPVGKKAAPSKKSAPKKAAAKPAAQSTSKTVKKAPVKKSSPSTKK